MLNQCYYFKNSKINKSYYILLNLTEYVYVDNETYKSDSKQIIINISDNNFCGFIGNDDIYKILSK